jgi:hypothetical protein
MSATTSTAPAAPIQIVFVAGVEVKRKSSRESSKSNSICIKPLRIENRCLNGHFMPYSSYPIELLLEKGSGPLTKRHYASKSMHRRLPKAITYRPKIRNEIET